MPILECNQLSKSYGKVPALDGVSFAIEPGRIVGLLGPNGSGKTTLIKLANGLLTPSSGEILIDGRTPGRETHAMVSYLPERTAIPTWMSAGQLMDFYEDFYPDFRRQAAEEMLHHLNIQPKQVDTGLETLTAGRILKVRDYIGGEPFLLTYGDGVSDVNIRELIAFHKKQGKTVTISTTQPEGRFGALRLDDTGSQVLGFKEKARADQAWVNIGFMVMEPSVYPYLGDGSTMLETLPFERLAADGQMAAYKHMGFWSPMDNIHDREYLQKLWDSGNAPWKV